MSVRISGYELEHRLGEGSHGTVWRARQVSAMNRPVAIKRLPSSTGLKVQPIAADGAAGDMAAAEGVIVTPDVGRLRHEAEVLVALDHPHIVPVFDVIEDGDGIAIVMRLAAGGSVADRLVRGRTFSLDEVLRIGAQVADALASAHRRGVLHLDVKPGNVLLTAEGDAMLADFGVAEWRHAQRPTTASGGSDGFVAPEVIAGCGHDQRADVFSLGRLLEVLAADHLSGSDASWLARLTGEMTSPEPDRRPPSCAIVAASLRAGRAPDPTSTEPTEPVAAGAEPAAAMARVEPATRLFGPRPPATPYLSSERRPPRAIVVAVVAAAVVVVGCTATFVTGGGAPTAAAGDTPPTVVASPARAPADASKVAVDCSPAPSSPPPAGGEMLLADIDGDGCDDPVVRSGNVLERNGIRFALGEPTDVPVLGDWNCDGVATPAIWRASSATAHLFDGWAAAGEPLPAVEVVDAQQAPATAC